MDLKDLWEVHGYTVLLGSIISFENSKLSVKNESLKMYVNMEYRDSSEMEQIRPVCLFGDIYSLWRILLFARRRGEGGNN